MAIFENATEMLSLYNEHKYLSATKNSAKVVKSSKTWLFLFFVLC